MARATLATIEEIDTALITLFTGIKITTLGGLKTVLVVAEPSLPQEITAGGSKTFPRMGFQLKSLEEDTAAVEAEEDDYEYSYDGLVSPPVRTMHEIPVPYILRYQVEAWTIDDTQALRQLVQRLVQLLKPKGYITVGSPVKNLWMFREGEVTWINQASGDQLIPQAVLTLRIHVELAGSAVRSVKVVTTNTVKMFEMVEDKKFREFDFTDTTFTHIE